MPYSESRKQKYTSKQLEQLEYMPNALPRYPMLQSYDFTQDSMDILLRYEIRYLDVHTVGLQFRIGTFGHGDTHQVQFCNDLVLRKFILITDGLDICSNIYVWSDFLHDKVLSF